MAVAALACVPQGAGAPPAAARVSVDSGSRSAVLHWQAPGEAAVRVEYGVDRRYGVWSEPSSGRAGRLDLPALEPATTYAYRLVDSAGKVLRTGSFTTAAPGAGRRSATVGAATLRVDGEPVFPRMVFRDCPWNFARSLAAGINVFLGSCEGDEALLSGLAGKALAVTDIGRRLEGPGLIGWYHRDEADLTLRPNQIPRLSLKTKASRVSFLTLSSHVWEGAAAGPLPRELYPAMVARGEVVGFTLYPLSSWCRRTFSPVHAAQRYLNRLAKGKPTFQWIEAGVMGDLPCAVYPHLHPTAETVRAETWLAIAGGARGIGYFPAPTWTEEIRAEITRINREIVALAPALLAPERPVRYGAKSPVHAGARELNGAVYAIAVNSSAKRTQRSFTLPGVKPGTAAVWGEDRQVAVLGGGRIVDTFAPFGVHIYVIPPA